ncbi:T9SS type B sorting domain-containing protein [uncultured Tenacibaculum sp.]|uniref:T9SS type B sorting domain-containing protein n=1 Tax=uncultured Tenacibaculum sp. TaxID=174713 RepID=UPI0026352BC0|nr:T9SS type B sorting domain-containing protein [uncultured Tenacibaculum sp.]
MIKKILFLLFCSSILYINAQNGASVCDAAEPMCSDATGVKIFNNVVNVAGEGTIGCLGTTPNPAWFFIKVQETGNLNFQIIQATSFDAAGNPDGTRIDVDFVAWGPFTTPDSNCTSLARTCIDASGNTIACESNTFSPSFYTSNTDGTNMVDCSYDSSPIETFTINNAQAGEFYVLLITNFANLPGQIKLQQTNFGMPGAGETDCSIVTGELGADQNVCEGTPVTLDGTPTLGTATSYEWQIDTGSGFTTIPGETNATLVINDNRSGTYKVIITDDTGNVAEDDVEITYFPVPVANPATDINFCDPDGDGFNEFDLQTDVTPQILGAQSATQFEVVYYLNQADADTNNTANALPNPYRNPTAESNQVIYARIHNTANTDVCFDTTSFALNVNGLPAPTQPIDYEVCDDVVNGGDTDGFYNNFMLATKDSEILGGLSAAQYNVSYHTTLTGAQTDSSTDVIDKNTAYRNTTINDQTIYVRVENRINTDCNAISEPGTSFLPFRLIVNPLPVLANPIFVIEQCENDGDFAATINLTQAQINISNNHTNETFKYYPSQADAIADTAEITDPVNYLANNGDRIWVRTISVNNCYRISELNIAINFAADISYTREFTSCDDFLDVDGNNNLNNDDRDGITNFDLSEAETDIKNLFAPAIRNDLDVLLFETETDRDAVINQITNISNYRNTSIPANTQQTLFVKIINKINNNCTGLGTLFIRTLPLPEFDITTPQILCLNNLSSIEVENPDDNYNYEWTRNSNPTVIGNAQQLSLTQGGSYTVTAINPTTLCRRSQTIVVNESIIATVNQSDVAIVDDSENNTITVNNNGTNLGVGDYEFALQDENDRIVIDFQDSPRFENLTGGIYTILIRDKNNCGIAQLDVSVLEFPDFFTPNNDGINDLWNIKGTNSFFYPQSSINIFDRFGKLITSLEIDSEGWNGLYNGKNLPSNDYWFNIQLTDRNGKTFTRRGHFSLLRK